MQEAKRACQRRGYRPRRRALAKAPPYQSVVRRPSVRYGARVAPLSQRLSRKLLPSRRMTQQCAASPAGLRLSCSPDIAAVLRAASRLEVHAAGRHAFKPPHGLTRTRRTCLPTSVLKCSAAQAAGTCRGGCCGARVGRSASLGPRWRVRGPTSAAQWHAEPT